MYVPSAFRVVSHLEALDLSRLDILTIFYLTCRSMTSEVRRVDRLLDALTAKLSHVRNMIPKHYFLPTSLNLIL